MNYATLQQILHYSANANLNLRSIPPKPRGITPSEFSQTEETTTIFNKEKHLVDFLWESSIA